MSMETNQSLCVMADECPCPKKGCANHGKCCLCIKAHRVSGKLVSCMKMLMDK